ncbi:MAG: type II secretion system protein [Armatimonadota bacterium]
MRRAFTLLELLVTVAILSVLAGMLFPVCAQVREKARQSTCLSNLRQVGMGLQMYLQDSDDCLPDTPWADLQFTPSPPAPAGPGPSSLRPYTRLGCLVAAFEPYIRDPRVWLCPSIPAYAGGSAWSDGLYGAYRVGGRDYPERGLSNYLSAKLAEPDPAKPRCARGKPVLAIGTGMPADEHLLYCGFYSRSWDPAPWRRGASVPPANGWQPHHLRRVELFFDGHAKAVIP